MPDLPAEQGLRSLLCSSVRDYDKCCPCRKGWDNPPASGGCEPWGAGQSVDETARGSGQVGVFLLDDHEIVRKGVRDLLEAEPDITVVGEAGTAASALARIPALRPDVAVLDVRLPDGDGVSVCREIRSKMPGVACLMLTSFGDDEALFDAIMAGAAGYVLKQIRGTDLVGAVRTVASGGSLLDPQAASKVMARMRDRSRKPDPLAGLTEQERKILELIGEGLTNRQIGERMFLAEKTVKNYVSSLFAKLGMERRTQAAAYAARVFEDTDHAVREPHDR
jgi:DNA-binding NarL/FixJ family response regulator